MERGLKRICFIHIAKHPLNQRSIFYSETSKGYLIMSGAYSKLSGGYLIIAGGCLKTADAYLISADGYLNFIRGPIQ